MTKYLLKLLVVVGFAGAAMAQGLPAFEEVDTNSDGQISQEEAAAIEGLDFATADTDQDGALSMEEYNAAQSE
jgi:EF hand